MATSGDPSPVIERGQCTVMFAFDVAMAIDVDAAARLVAGERERLQGSSGGAGGGGGAAVPGGGPPVAEGGAGGSAGGRKTPTYFEYKPPPLRTVVAVEPVALNGVVTRGELELLIFDFGAVSAAWRLDLSGRTMGDVLGLSERLFNSAPLLDEARRRVDELLRRIAPALIKPGRTEQAEDYLVYEFQEVRVDGRTVSPASLAGSHGPLLARILRSERAALGDEETADALACRVGYGPDDAAIIDWNAAVLLDREAEDVRAVLEFANVELLEMRFLDDRLDEILEEAFGSLARPRVGMRAFLPLSSAESRRLAQLQMDSALLFENVNNALKLIGDQYLARVYRLAAQRFHLPERDKTIERKLSTLESIYSKLNDHDAGRRADVLTWIIILLIAFDIVHGLLSL